MNYRKLFKIARALSGSLIGSLVHASEHNECGHMTMQPVALKDVKITDGFWADRQQVNREVTLVDLWERANDPATGHVIQNFEIAAGRREGTFAGTHWQDAWLYKWIETAAYELAMNPNAVFDGQRLDVLVDELIGLIGEAQEEDGYLATQVTARPQFGRFEDYQRHELYTMGHLLTAASVHYRVTGNNDLLKIAQKNARFVYEFFSKNQAQYPDFPNNPSIIMGAMDLYRVTRDKLYLKLAEHFVDARGKYPPKPKTSKEINAMPYHIRAWKTSEGYINTQNWVPLRDSHEVLGHAVFFTYLYAGAADVYMETGDETLVKALDRLWHDLTEKKMYVTGGVSPHHMSFPTFSFKDGVRKIMSGDFMNEGVARPYDMPQAHGYNETCGMVGNMMWNWRMLQATGEERFADIMELNWYNSIISGVEVDGVGWSYANPLRWHAHDHEVIHELKYSHKRGFPGRKLICCPTNIMRNVSAFGGFLYGLSDAHVWVNHYAASELDTVLPSGETVSLKQKTNFPWDGKVELSILSEGLFSLKLRIPYWADSAGLKVNGRALDAAVQSGAYVEISRDWNSGDQVELTLPMEVKLMVSDYKMEESRGQVAIKRGPVVYCLESIDLPAGVAIEDVLIPSDASWEAEYDEKLLGGVTVLKTMGMLAKAQGARIGAYRELGNSDTEFIPIKLIPYYAWNNREEPKMSVWLPLGIR